LSSKEKEEIDAHGKLLLRQLSQAIKQLAQTEQDSAVHEEQIAILKRARGGFGALGRWAAGGAVTAKSPEEEVKEAARRQVRQVRASVIYFLELHLDEAGQILEGMIRVRLGREVERSKSVLCKSRMGGGGVPYALDDADTPRTQTRQGTGMVNGYDPAIPEPAAGGRDSAVPELSPEQQQLLEEENTALLKHYNNQLSQLSTTEKSIMEISELHTTLVTNLQLQSEHIDQLVQDSYLTQENLGRGNKELKKASERRSTAQTFFYATVGLCSFLVIWDLIF
jgi:syntaxin 18